MVLLKKGDLYNLAQEFYLKHGGRLMCIDEIHRYANWNQEIKNIYDALPDLKIIFSGSSSLNLVKGKNDLSRRGIIYKLPGLSFREYLFFLDKNHATIAEYLNILEETCLIRFLTISKSGHSLVRKPKKVFLVLDNILIADSQIIPLYLFGFLY